MTPEKAPVTPSWSDIKLLLLQTRDTGIEPDCLPSSFLVSSAMLEVFREMCPEKIGLLGGVDDITKRAGLKPIPPEVTRAILTTTGSNFLVHQTNRGEGYTTPAGMAVRTESVPGQFGLIHTHPVNVAPSSNDVIPILTGQHLLEIVVTPMTVYILVRQTTTTFLQTNFVAQGYLRAMGRRQAARTISPLLDVAKIASEVGCIFIDISGWTLTFDDLLELNIASYTAPRKNQKFSRIC